MEKKTLTIAEAIETIATINALSDITGIELNPNETYLASVAVDTIAKENKLSITDASMAYFAMLTDKSMLNSHRNLARNITCDNAVVVGMEISESLTKMIRSAV